WSCPVAHARLGGEMERNGLPPGALGDADHHLALLNIQVPNKIGSDSARLDFRHRITLYSHQNLRRCEATFSTACGPRKRSLFCAPTKKANFLLTPDNHFANRYRFLSFLISYLVAIQSIDRPSLCLVCMACRFAQRSAVREAKFSIFSGL